ncbi:MAG TPA: hypothetical protein VE957_17355 [Terriglobales bacterium]|nr:hypothetical protein [Terriglobales bacterium]
MELLGLAVKGGRPPDEIKVALGMALLRLPLLVSEVDPEKDALIHAAGEAAVLLDGATRLQPRMRSGNCWWNIRRLPISISRTPRHWAAPANTKKLFENLWRKQKFRPEALCLTCAWLR